MRCTLKGLMPVIGMLLFTHGVTAWSEVSVQERLEAVRSKFNYPGTTRLTPDGQWLIYEFIQGRPSHYGGEVTVVARHTGSDVERRFAAGLNERGAGVMELSPSGRWFGFRRARAESEGAGTAVVVVETATGKTVEHLDQQSFRFAGEGSEWIVLQGSTRSGHDASHLTVHELGTAMRADLGSASAFVLNPTGSRLAWVSEDGVYEYTFATRRIRTLEAGTGLRYRDLTWSQAGNALAMLRGDRSDYDLVTVRRLDTQTPKKIVLNRSGWGGFPSGYQISANAAPLAPVLSWREDERGVFFAIRPIEKAKEEPPAHPVPNLVLWHWRDQMPPQPGAGEPRHLSFWPTHYLSYVSLADRHFVSLADPTLAVVQPHERGRYVLGFDARKDTGPYSSGSTYNQRDYYLVELSSGRRIPVVTGLWVSENVGLSTMPRLSPDGRVVLYQDNEGHLQAFTVATGKRRNLTVGLPTRFYHPENLHQRTNVYDDENWLRSVFFQGWSTDGAYALVSDYRDVWALPLREGKALNLTGNGQREGIVYQRTLLTALSKDQPTTEWDALAEDRVDWRQPIYFHARHSETGLTGLARWLSSEARLEMLHWDAARIGWYHKAEQAPLYVVFRNAAGEFPDYYRLDAAWRPTTRLTDLNPAVRAMGWREPYYIGYPAEDGKRRHTVIYPPYDAALRPPYPTIVEIYEHLEGAPYDGWELLGSRYDELLAHGYAILHAHIQPKPGAPGAAALEGVQGAVRAAVAAGVIDPERLALTGFSYGGYETNFIISQTNLFKAAVSRAGLSNLINECNRVYPNGFTRSESCLYSQPFVGGWWWDNLQAYTDNSPLFHARNIRTPLLLVHGDQDDGVPFTQAVELFNTLYNMGDKPVVLLQYVGSDHSAIDYDKATQRDIYIRMRQFFDHHLKGALAPAWWAEGRSYTQGRAPASK